MGFCVKKNWCFIFLLFGAFHKHSSFIFHELDIWEKNYFYLFPYLLEIKAKKKVKKTEKKIKHKTSPCWIYRPAHTLLFIHIIKSLWQTWLFSFRLLLIHSYILSFLFSYCLQIEYKIHLFLTRLWLNILKLTTLWFMTFNATFWIRQLAIEHKMLVFFLLLNWFLFRTLNTKCYWIEI